jgi:hypothetical protein
MRSTTHSETVQCQTGSAQDRFDAKPYQRQNGSTSKFKPYQRQNGSFADCLRARLVLLPDGCSTSKWKVPHTRCTFPRPPPLPGSARPWDLFGCPSGRCDSGRSGGVPGRLAMCLVLGHLARVEAHCLLSSVARLGL